MSDRSPKPADLREETGQAGVHPIVVKIAIGAVLWFLGVTWLAFAHGAETDFLLVIVVLFFAFFLGLFLLTASFTTGDRRWPVQEMSLGKFLNSDVGIGSGTLRGRDVLIQIALVPVALAFAATLIGLAWVIFG